MKYIEGSHNENVSGNYISFSKNVRNCFLVREGEHLRYCQYVQESPGSKDCYDYSIWGDNNRFVYECCASGINTNMIKFCVYVQEGVSEIEYSYCCSASSNLFGCIGVRRKQYCILNKQYEKEDYFRLVEEIKKQMMNVPYIDGGGREYRYGEFFPIEMSPIDYNQSVSFEYFPKSEKEVLREGWGWKKVFERDIKIDVASGTLDDEINNVQDDVLQKVIQCEHNGTCGHPCTKGFRIISKELSFYRRFGLPLPRLCPNCRHLERVEQRTGFVIKSMKCHCKGREGGVYINTAKHDHGDHPCENNIETCYTEKEADIVYCEACYKSEFL